MRIRRYWTTTNLLLSIGTCLVRAFLPTSYHAPSAWLNKSHRSDVPLMIENNKSNKEHRHNNENKRALISYMVLCSTSTRSNGSNARSSAADSRSPPPQDVAVQFAPPPFRWVLPLQHWLEHAAVLASVLARIVGASLHPQMWRHHWQNSHKLITVALVVAQAAISVTVGGLLPAAMAGQVIGAVILLRCYLLPAVYASLLAVCWNYLCHNGHLDRMLHGVYVLAPWWFSNKLLMTDDGEAHVPALLHTLMADAATVDMAHAFARAREESHYNICDATYLADHSGALVLYTHSFGPAVTSSPDWSHVVMHCCYGRILDDYQDLEEDVRDGKVARNFFLLFHHLRQQQQQEHHAAAASTATTDVSNVEHDITTQRLVVQAMRDMRWHEEQMQDLDVQQYARGVRKSLEVMMLFKSSAFKQTWQEALAEATTTTVVDFSPSSSSPLLPQIPWPFASLVTTVAPGRNDL